ncbi:hypothetical protein CAOG_05052 [Capsaspora owczarzaki ATCC 30864]|uniref:O-methyltransferase C-terminal domain-containing protein n=1 Tax=Capsaspora owczarzaki (strain ATCC 30864) TaxID=595528 RepID=A0A0D2X3J3_CAPO3|nr:hypothetical protein CAOG_05052 [Capsaspora owczarzaki ATCC 30864]KJE94409.1 hypothetical protein CAOG_005052 [Capsaspora owczarzaki ATCC 30864]|eukprot:XP_004346737.1 hypothetical protein CAOG_05052 [Capsaspora owczarzaki ATCC 30864]
MASVSGVPIWPDAGIRSAWLSQWQLPSLSVGIQIGLFKLLDSNPGLTSAQISESLKVSKRGIDALTAVLGALTFLECRGGAFHNSVETSLYLLEGSQFFWGHMLMGRPGSEASALHRRLHDAIVHDQVDPGAVNEWEAGSLPDPERAAAITRGMHSHSVAPAMALAASPRFKALNVTKLLDVGGGSGCFPIAMAQANPAFKGVVMEIDTVGKCALEFVAEAKVSEQITTIARNMFKDAWPTPAEGFNGVFFSNIFHDWNHAQNTHLARSAFNTLAPGGRILLHETLLNDDSTGPFVAAAFSMHMLVYTRGKQFTFKELQELLTSVGFVDVQVFPTYSFYSIVHARKP